MIFHSGSTERIRGSVPPDSTLSNPTGDMTVEPFPERIGCTSPKLIAGWRENLLWADERGVYMTDGSLTTTITSTGGVSRLWRLLWEQGAPQVQAAGVFGDYYVVSLQLNNLPTQVSWPYAINETAFTFVCDLPSRSWCTFGNIPASCFVATQGAGFESLFAGNYITGGVMNLTSCFSPIRFDGEGMVDGDDNRVQPLIETGWNRIGPPGKKRAAMIFPGYFLAAQDEGAPPNLLVEVNRELAAPEDVTFVDLPKRPRASAKYRRDRVPVRMMDEGFAFRFSVEGQALFSDFAFFDLTLQGFSVEEMRAP
jgi:hypothetical protein